MPPKKAAAAAAPTPLSEVDANRVKAPATRDAAKPAARKRKSDAASAPAARKQATKKKDDPLPDLSGIRLPGDDTMGVPVYDTCDAVRTKIRALLKKDGVTKAAFLRALVKAAYPPGSDHKIAPNLLTNFMNKKGAGAGNTSSVFYAAYVFFEKLRVRDNKPKSKKREEMERERGPAGFDTENNMSNMWVTVHESEKVGIDKYGKTQIVPRGDPARGGLF